MLRIAQLAVVLVRYGLWPLVARRDRQPGPVRMRLALQTLGGTWIKLGQLLALRFDLLPSEYCYELFKLLNEVKPFPYEQVRKTIHQDLGAYPEELFAEFEPESFAAASIGQVHRAVLHSGQRVAVKVQRPQIRKIIQADLRLMYLAAFFVDITPFLGGVRARTIVHEFARWTGQELDYTVEGRNAFDLREGAAGDSLEHDAEVYFEYTSPRVLTMELIEGVSLVDIMYAQRDHKAAYLQALQTEGYDLKVIATHIAWNVLNQVYYQGYFHADLHPANLFVMPGNAIAYVDFGIVGSLPSEVRESLLHYAWNLFHGKVDRAAEEFMRWVQPTDRTDVRAARDELTRALEDYLFALKTGGTRQRRGPPGSSDFEVDILNAVRSNGMTVNPAIVTYFKALVTANAVIFELDPVFDLMGLERRFFGRLIMQESRVLLDARQATGAIFDYSYRVLRALGSVHQLQAIQLETGGFLLRIRRRIQVAAALSLLAGVGLYFGFARHSGTWVATGLALTLVAASVGLVYYGRQITQPGPSTRGLGPRLPRTTGPPPGRGYP